MTKAKLDPKILEYLKKKIDISEKAIRNAISKIRGENPSLTLNAAAQILAKKRNLSIARWLKPEDRKTLKTVRFVPTKVATKNVPKKQIIIIATYETDDKFLQKHLDEINKAYTYGCYTATFILCRKVLENLIIHHILKKKYPRNTLDHRQKYFDINTGRYHFFNKLIDNFRSSSKDFLPERPLVERISQLADGFRETANEMTHSLYHIAKKNEIDDKNFQELLDLIDRLVKSSAMVPI